MSSCATIRNAFNYLSEFTMIFYTNLICDDTFEYKSNGIDSREVASTGKMVSISVIGVVCASLALLLIYIVVIWQFSYLSVIFKSWNFTISNICWYNFVLRMCWTSCIQDNSLEVAYLLLLRFENFTHSFYFSRLFSDYDIYFSITSEFLF